MKTAMQELIDELNLIESYPMNSLVLRKATTLLQKEKEQIIKAMNYCIYREMKGINVSNEDYYNQSYKK